MNNEIKELNEYLAVNMFGLKKDIDFGEPTSFCCKEQELHFYEYGHIACWSIENSDCFCTECGAVIDESIISLSPLEDYTENYQSVLEKLSRLCFEITIEVIESGMAEITAKYHFGTINVVGNNLGEAICRCAVEYLKRSKKDE